MSVLLAYSLALPAVVVLALLLLSPSLFGSDRAMLKARAEAIATVLRAAAELFRREK